ncbi:tyrosine-protein phosphatase non-receptor type 9 [Trichonephila inaurata madagascariensis]|uniref:Tyrosine-protein phosphatase non-receptor type 9 n=1 Tax=Trichonephila inaurata madagascariensis TaxID=2747483 RepID=A0A8X6M778_9ARAC|nr:tyrosine-protein phosphatase non-receptor type 9 [Trichonephila inaurata madagascariensis]
MAEVLTDEEREIVKEFVAIVKELQLHKNGDKKSWNEFTAVKFMMARKFDICRAVALFEAHEVMRRREGLIRFDPTSDALRNELETGKFTILPVRDATGAAIAIFTAHKHIPLETSHQITLQGVIYQLDIALESLETQRHGIVFIYNMTGSKYANFDYELSQKMLNLLKGGYPARLKKVLIVAAPLWFKASFKIFQLFLREKLRDRLFMVNIPQLCMHIPPSSLPEELGGTFQVDHKTWLQHCLKSTINRCMDEICDSSSATPTECPYSGFHLRHFNDSDMEENSDHHNDSVHEKHNSEEREKEVEVLKESMIFDPAQYSDIKNTPPEGTFETSKLKVNQCKNRYTDVLCYDHSRVKLPIIDGDPYSDYINANYVDGYKQKHAFISTQGPLPKTCADFWRMVWDQESHIIVMTTKTVERGRIKCGQYWPAEENTVQEYEDFDVYNSGVEYFPDYIVSNLVLTNKKQNTSQEVCHMQFTSWPDFGVPPSALAMLDFRDKVRRKQAQAVEMIGAHWLGHPLGPPIVVHCSAGIGRTGTFITLDICINKLEATGLIDIVKTVEKIRAQRAYSIQMPDQYVFCHLALLEYALSRGLLEDVDLSGFND